MALQFLPPAAILQAHVDYVRRNWIDRDVWPLSTWSVLMQLTRTNNDVEGWQRRLNGKAGRSQLNMYQLVELLINEDTLDNVSMMSEDDVARVQRKKYNK